MATNSRSEDHTGRLSERAATIAKDVRRVGDATRKVAVDSADALKETARDYFDEGSTQVRHLGDRMVSQLRDQPIKAVLISAGVGFLLGAIWTRR